LVLVVGATGTLGGRIVQRLLLNGEAVRILKRRDSPAVEMAATGIATPLDSRVAAGAEPVYGDLIDRASLARVCAGVETVVATATSTKRQPPDTIERVDLQGTLNLIDAARSQGVARFVYISLYGSALDHPVPLFHSKAVCKTRLAESGTDYVILQPDLFMEVWIGMVVEMPLRAGRSVTLVGRGDHRHSFVSEADVAAIAVVAALDPELSANMI
jgi:uncharacterized protein YbjT (DUF2867 family)